MTLEIEDRPSDSPYVERVWRSRSTDVAQMMSIATPRWSLVLWEQSDEVYVAVLGPETRASHAPVPEYATFFGIDFALGTTLPQLPVSRIAYGYTEVPAATRTSFWLGGSTWHRPDYDNAEAFVRRLVREDVVAHDPLVTDVVRGAVPGVSDRTVQRHFLATTGLTRGTVRQIDRARHATQLLRERVPTAEVVDRLGYYDQPHLARSLSRYIGRPATSLAAGDDVEPLSLLYKT